MAGSKARDFGSIGTTTNLLWNTVVEEGLLFSTKGYFSTLIRKLVSREGEARMTEWPTGNSV